ncbi:MAG: hypothetical protein BWY85_00438 [Firmicutes bacterium ADurb.Bin506]|nr:MAG: hypothetical protein BWY85_00438 [Firmicutes bacterium ADurb.Bin506]
MSATAPDHDPVHSPSHYTSGGIECIDAMRATFHPSEFAAFCKLNAFKYLWRAGKKGSEIEDLEKGQVYLGWALEALDADQPVKEEGETVRERAQREFREGIERAGMTAYGPDDDVPTVILTFGSGIHPSITDCFSDDCDMPEDCPVDCCDEALTESPHPVPDRAGRHRSDSAVGVVGRLFRSGRKRTRIY